MSDHTHKCAFCGYEWQCLHYTLKKCKASGVFRAAQVNGAGPFCQYHRHLIMAVRHAKHQGLPVENIHNAVEQIFSGNK